MDFRGTETLLTITDKNNYHIKKKDKERKADVSKYETAGLLILWAELGGFGGKANFPDDAETQDLKYFEVCGKTGQT